jgi:hypothetical protein
LEALPREDNLLVVRSTDQLHVVPDQGPVAPWPTKNDFLEDDVISVEGAARYSDREASVIYYGVASRNPLFLADSKSAIGVAAASFGIPSPITVDAQSVLTLGDLAFCMRVDDSIDLMVNRSCWSYGGLVVDTFFIGGVFGAADER